MMDHDQLASAIEAAHMEQVSRTLFRQFAWAHFRAAYYAALAAGNEAEARKADQQATMWLQAGDE